MSEMTYRDVVRLLELIDASDSADVELDMDGLRLKVTRAGGGAGPAQAQRAVALPAAAEPGPAEIGAKDSVSAARPDAAADHPGATAVAAPMGGVFYASPAPGQPPFVTEGQEVKAGDQLGIVEVMKLFTAITAPCDGVVVAILVENQGTVAKDDNLMLIEAKP